VRIDDVRVIGCRSDALAVEIEGDILVHAASGIVTLKAGDDKARHQLISSIRGGQHAELDVVATTFRQKDGVPNKRYLRHKPEALEALASSFEGMPMLLDHNSWEQRARMGTIRTSKLHEHGGTGWSSFKMGLRVVKPEAVISVLDGTLDRFSIGWSATGPVMCTAHKVDVRSSSRCGCWPGDRVEVDGKQHVVEYEFQSAEGTEVSAVNVPAVKGTKIEDVRSALAAELGFAAHVVNPSSARREMSFPRLAAILGLSALAAPTDEDGAIRAAEGLQRRALAAEQERDTARARITTLENELATSKAAGSKAAVDALIDGAYRDGKLRMGRDSEGAAIPSKFEAMYRKLAASEGIDALRSELAGLPQVVPIGKRPLDSAGEPPRDNGGELTDDEKSVADQMGMDHKEFLASKREMGAR
jgi:hypothetical protein